MYISFVKLSMNIQVFVLTNYSDGISKIVLYQLNRRNYTIVKDNEKKNKSQINGICTLNKYLKYHEFKMLFLQIESQ